MMLRNSHGSCGTGRIDFLSVLVGLSCLTVSADLGHAHLSQQLKDKAENIHRLVEAYEAEAVVTDEALVRVEPLASGGKAAAGATGTTFRIETPVLKRGMYGLYISGRVPAKRLSREQDGPPIYMEMSTDSGVGGREERYRVACHYHNTWQYIAELYFHAIDDRAYKATLAIGKGTSVEPLIDRVELRDALSGTVFGAFKNGRYLYTDEEIRLIREKTRKEYEELKAIGPKELAARTRGKDAKPEDKANWSKWRGLDKLFSLTMLSPEQQQMRDRIVATHTVPPINAVYPVASGEPIPEEAKAKLADKKWREQFGEWKHPFRHYYYTPFTPLEVVNEKLGIKYSMSDFLARRPVPDPWPFKDPELDIMAKLFERRYHYYGQAFQEVLGGSHKLSMAQEHLRTGNRQLARDAAFFLAVAAYRWPAFNFRLTQTSSGKHHKVKRLADFKRQWGKLHIYRGWASRMIRGMLRSYDILFPFIRGNQELASAIGKYVPWVKTPEEVIALLDTYFVQLAFVDGLRHQGEQQVELIAAVLGPNGVSKKLMTRHSSYRDRLISEYSRDGLTYIGSTFYSRGPSQTPDLLAKYVRAGGDKRYDIADVKRFPRLAAYYDSLLQLHVLSGYSAVIGDVGGPNPRRRWKWSLDPNAREGFAWAWQTTDDRRYAWMLRNVFGRAGEEAETWRGIEAAAESVRDPRVHLESGVLGGFGLAILRDDPDTTDFRRKRALLVRAGVGSGHAQSDTLDLNLFMHGICMVPDMGGRSRGQYGHPSCHTTYVHNVVEVDGKSHNDGPLNSTSVGWIDCFKPNLGAQFLIASARSCSHPYLTRYQRDTALVCVDPPSADLDRSPNSYVFDVFRVAGGQTHTWCFHGNEPDNFQTNVVLKSAEDEWAQNYLRGHGGDSRRQGIAEEVVEATWWIGRKIEKSILREEFDENSPQKAVKMSLFGHPGARVMVGNFYAKKARKLDIPCLYVQEPSEGKTRSSAFASIIEPYAGDPFIKTKRRLHVEGPGKGAEAAVAAAVETANGHHDLLFSDGAGAETCSIEGGTEVVGRFAFYSEDEDGFRLLHLVGGKSFENGAIRTETAERKYDATIQEIDYEAGAFTVDKTLPAELLRGERMRLGNASHACDYQIRDAAREGKGTKIAWHKSAAVYRSSVDELVLEDATIIPSSLPPLFDYHPTYYDGMTIVAEDGKSWKADFERGERWMYLGFPVAQQHQQRISMDDVPDANGDGKRTLAMFVDENARAVKQMPDGSKGELEPGEKMLDIEITRVSDDGLTLFLKQHPLEFLDSLGVPHPGWPYHRRILKNEDGTRTWTSVLPEDTVRIVLKGDEPSKGDFPDVDGDGRRSFTVYDFGEGDRFELLTHIFITRKSKGVYEVRSDVEATIALPGKTAEISTDGQQWQQARAIPADGKVALALSTAQLANGPLFLRVE